MKEVEIMKDLLQQKISSQVAYNERMIRIRNPEVRMLFSQMRDDEMRCIVELQQRITRMETVPKTIAKIFIANNRY
jgi:hypothetical protein